MPYATRILIVLDTGQEIDTVRKALAALGLNDRVTVSKSYQDGLMHFTREMDAAFDLVITKGIVRGQWVDDFLRAVRYSPMGDFIPVLFVDKIDPRCMESPRYRLFSEHLTEFVRLPLTPAWLQKQIRALESAASIGRPY